MLNDLRNRARTAAMEAMGLAVAATIVGAIAVTVTAALLVIVARRFSPHRPA